MVSAMRENVDKTKGKRMHRQTIDKMCKAAKMDYAPSGDPDSPVCWFIWDNCNILDMPKWVPSWANGVNPESLYEWMLEQSATNPEIHKAMKDAGMRPRKPSGGD